MKIGYIGLKVTAQRTPVSPATTIICNRRVVVYSVYAKDLDNDGDMDMLSATANDDKDRLVRK